MLLTEGRRWSIWLSLLLQSFKHDAVLDAGSEIGASMAERRCSAHADVEQSDGGTLSARKSRDPLSS